MAISFVAAGTVSAANGSTITPGLPAGWAADDIHLLLVVSQGGTTATASGWTEVWTENNNNGGTNCQVTLLWRRAVGGDSAPTTNTLSDGSMGVIVGYRGCATSGDPWSAFSRTTTDNFDTTMTAPGITPGSANDMVILLGGGEPLFASPTFSGYSGTNPTFTERVDSASSLGTNYAGLCIADGTTDGSATGDRTITCSTSIVYVAGLIALKSGGAPQGNIAWIRA